MRPGDRLWDAQRQPTTELLHELAHVETGTAIPVQTDAATDPQGQFRSLTLQPDRPGTSLRWLQWAASVIPEGADRNKLQTLTYLMMGLVAVIAFANLFRYFGEVLIAKAILRAMMRLRTDLYERTLHLPMSFFSGRSSSDLVGRFVQDIQEIQRGMLSLFSKFLREPLRTVFILGLAFTLDWRLTLTVVLVTPIVGVVFWRVGRSVKKSNRKLLEAYGSMIGTLTSSLQNLRVVKAYTAEDHERARLREVDKRVLKQQLKLTKLQALVSPMLETVAVFAGCMVGLWLASRVLNRELELATFGALGVALSMLFDPLRKLSDVYVRVQRASAGAERIFQVIDQPVESDISPSHVELKPLEQSIEYINVSYTYPGAETPALKDVSLSIQKGETVAIVGPNGCGKTTMVSMLPRFFHPDSGEIRYDGVDIRDATLRSLRAQIGLVTQEAIVFAGTPFENITYGQSHVDEHRAKIAAGRASADEFIRGIPGGYDANLGERGTTLSGGERQRLAIARAIFRDAPTLIFDEATSQIDSESELKIQTTLQEFARGRTTLIIAHRLSTIQFADRIIVMDAGKVIDSGTHKELFERCPLYRSLCETQFVTGPRHDDDGSQTQAES